MLVKSCRMLVKFVNVAKSKFKKVKVAKQVIKSAKFLLKSQGNKRQLKRKSSKLRAKS